MSPLRRFPARTGVATLAAPDRAHAAHDPRHAALPTASATDWPIQQPGEIITLLFAAPGDEIVLPLQRLVLPARRRPSRSGATTPSAATTPPPGEIDVDVVLHEPRGPACTWAAGAPLGAPVGYAGPRVDFAAPRGAQWLLLCGDETALPAIAAILESPPPAERVLAVVEVPDPAEEHELALPDGAEVALGAPRRARAATTSHLADALRALDAARRPRPGLGRRRSRGSRATCATVLRGERGMPRRHVKATGYWLRARIPRD